MTTTCVYCREPVDPAGPAVLLGLDHPVWQPFLEDLRSSGFDLARPTCFAKEKGVEALIAIVTASDRKQRASFWRLMGRVEAAKSQRQP